MGIMVIIQTERLVLRGFKEESRKPYTNVPRFRDCSLYVPRSSTEDESHNFIKRDKPSK